MASRRQWLKAVVAALGGIGASRRGRALAAAPELVLPGDTPTQAYDFGAGGIAGWTIVAGQWTVEELADSPSGRKALVQRATRNEFNVVVAPGRFRDVDVSVMFKPISGREDASGGIVFRFDGGKYYVVRANALEDNFRLYHYDRGRRQIATTAVKAPALGQWHTVRLVAVGSHMQAWLDRALLLDHHDSRLGVGQVGLWTKADSVTAFDGLSVRGKKED
jgi:hypothetical protein